MRPALFVVAVGCLTAACGSKNNEGLPPAPSWGSAAAKAAPVEPPPPETLAPMGVDPKGNDQLPPGHPPVGGSGDNHPPVASKTPPRSLEKLADGRLALGPYALTLPAGWSEIAVDNDMRHGQFKVADDAEIIVFYFGPDGAGTVEQNFDRWAGQFTAGDGKPAMKTEKIKVTGADADLMFVIGKFSAMAMPGAPPPVDKADQAMLGAITPSPQGPYYWKFIGGKTSVTANDAKFRALLTGLKLK